ncbi:MAG: helix-turn-helix transcriptional regulator [Pseudomonadota bacterium]
MVSTSTYIFSKAAIDLKDAISRGLRARGMTIVELAEALQISRTSVYRILGGDLRLRHEWAEKLADIFGGTAAEWTAIATSSDNADDAPTQREPENGVGTENVKRGPLSKVALQLLLPTRILAGYRDEPHNDNGEYELRVSRENIVGSADDVLSIPARQMIGCATSELFKLPSDIECLVSVAQEAVDLGLAPIGLNYIPPGFAGRPRFILHNLADQDTPFSGEITVFRVTFRYIS